MSDISQIRSARLSGRRALVTGAARGIGRATALAMASEGASVIATDKDADMLSEVQLAGPAGSYSKIERATMDVTDPESIAAVRSSAGNVDILVNCAGFVHDGTLLECTASELARAFAINVQSMHWTIAAFLPGMVERRAGSIINIGSVVSSIKGVPRRFAYGTTKAAVIGLSKAVAADFIHAGIRCNVICPGTVDTPSLRERMAKSANEEEAVRLFTARQPMGRLGTAEEIADLAVYLASDASRFMTGTALTIDGGFSL